MEDPLTDRPVDPSLAPALEPAVGAAMDATVAPTINSDVSASIKSADRGPENPALSEAKTVVQLPLKGTGVRAQKPRSIAPRPKAPSKGSASRGHATFRTHTSPLDAEHVDLGNVEKLRSADELALLSTTYGASGSSSAGLNGLHSPNSDAELDPSQFINVQQQDGVRRSIATESSDGIEILVKLAAAGEFDPKNIDIIEVTDKFLKAIAAAPKENLRQSGKILFHASVLLRMKAEALLAAAVQELDPQDDFLEFDENGSGLIYDSRKEIVGRQITLEDLERALVRRTHTRQNRQRKVTLDQLIDALRQAEKIERTRAEKKPARAVIELAGQHEARDVDDLLDLAHDEDIEGTIDRIERMLADYTTSGDMITLLVLIKMLDGNGDWVDAFLAVLFLSNAGKITLEQQEFYGPLYVVRADEPEQKPEQKTSSLA